MYRTDKISCVPVFFRTVPVCCFQWITIGEKKKKKVPAMSFQTLQHTFTSLFCKLFQAGMISCFGNLWHPSYVGWRCEEWLLIDVTWLAQAAIVVTVILAKTVLLSELLPSFVEKKIAWINTKIINTRKQGDLCAVLWLWSCWDDGDMVAWLAWLQCCNGGIKTL